MAQILPLKRDVATGKLGELVVSADTILLGDVLTSWVVAFGTSPTPDAGISRLDINQLAVGNGAAADITGGLTVGGLQIGTGDSAIDANTRADFGETKRVWAANRIFVPVPPVYVDTPSVGYIYPLASVTVSNNTLTVVGTNSLVAGQRVEFFVMTASFLNFEVVTVATASSSQFTARFVHADYPTTADAGIAYVFSAVFALSVVAENDPAVSNRFPAASVILQSIVSSTAVTGTALEFPKGPTALYVTTSHEGAGNFASDPWYSLVGAAIEVDNEYSAHIPNVAVMTLNLGTFAPSLIDTAYSLFITGNGGQASTIGTSYNIYIQTQPPSFSATRWAIYEENAAENNALGNICVGGTVSWGSSYGTSDASLSRGASSGIVCVGTGAAGSYAGSLKLTGINLQGVSASQLVATDSSKNLVSAGAVPQTFAPALAGSPPTQREFLTGYSAGTGAFAAAQPSYSDLSGTPAAGTVLWSA